VAKRLVCLLGSPRRGGNTDVLARQVCAAFAEQGGEVQELPLSRLELRPCTGCDWCKQEHDRPCVIQDDMQMVYQRMLAADAILWATPVYSWAPTVELKIVLDRQFAWGDYQSTSWARALAERPVGAVVAYADPDPATNGFYHCYHIVRVVAEASGGRFIGCAHGAASARGEIAANRQTMDAAYALGVALYGEAARRSPQP